MYQLEWGAGNSVISVLPADRGRGLADFTGFQMSVAGSLVGGEPSPKGGGGVGWGGLEPDHKEDGQFPKQLIEDRHGALEGMAIDGDVVEEDTGQPGGGRACQLAAAAGAAGSVMGGRRSQQAQHRTVVGRAGKNRLHTSAGCRAWAVWCALAPFPPRVSLIFQICHIASGFGQDV